MLYSRLTAKTLDKAERDLEDELTYRVTGQPDGLNFVYVFVTDAHMTRKLPA